MNPIYFISPKPVWCEYVFIASSLSIFFGDGKMKWEETLWDPICKCKYLSAKVASCGSLVFLHQNHYGQPGRWESSSLGI